MAEFNIIVQAFINFEWNFDWIEMIFICDIIILFLYLLVIYYMSLFNVNVNEDQEKSLKEIKALEKEIDELKKEQEELKKLDTLTDEELMKIIKEKEKVINDKTALMEIAITLFVAPIILLEASLVYPAYATLLSGLSIISWSISLYIFLFSK